MKVGIWQLLIVLLIVLVLFGPKNLPKLGSAIGKTIGNFKKGLNEDETPGEKDTAEAASTDEEA